MGFSRNDELLRLLEAVTPLDRGEYAVSRKGLDEVFAGEVETYWKGTFDGTAGIVARAGDSLYFVSYASGTGMAITHLDGLEGGLLTETFHDAKAAHATSEIGTLIYSLNYSCKGHTVAMTALEDWMLAQASSIRDLLRAWSTE